VVLVVYYNSVMVLVVYDNSVMVLVVYDNSVMVLVVVLVIYIVPYALKINYL
jgi:hypothetical protein